MFSVCFFLFFPASPSSACLCHVSAVFRRLVPLPSQYVRCGLSLSLCSVPAVCPLRSSRAFHIILCRLLCFAFRPFAQTRYRLGTSARKTARKFAGNAVGNASGKPVANADKNPPPNSFGNAHRSLPESCSERCQNPAEKRRPDSGCNVGARFPARRARSLSSLCGFAVFCFCFRVCFCFVFVFVLWRQQKALPEQSETVAQALLTHCRSNRNFRKSRKSRAGYGKTVDFGREKPRRFFPFSFRKFSVLFRFFGIFPEFSGIFSKPGEKRCKKRFKPGKSGTKPGKSRTKPVQKRHGKGKKKEKDGGRKAVPNGRRAITGQTVPCIRVQRKEERRYAGRR